MLRTFIQITALTLTLISSIFLIKSSLTLTAQDIAKLSSTYWGYNPPLINNLSRQQAETMVGAVLLLIAFFLQMINLTWPMRIKDFGVTKKGVILGICVSVIIGILSSYISHIISAKTQKEVSNILTQERQSKK